MNRRPYLVVLILIIFFVISFLTNILGPIIPDLISGFNLSLGLAGFIPFSFFIAYGVMSVPAGLLIDRFSEKPVILLSFGLAFAGAILFALFPEFSVALVSLFLIGIGMAMLQVAINPLLREAGGESEFAFNSVLAQVFFGGASYLSPWLYSYLVRTVHSAESNWVLDFLNRVVPRELNWISLYWVFALTSLVMISVISLVSIRKVKLEDNEKIESGTVIIRLLKNKTVLLYVAGIFAYVGTEQGIANWISKFLQMYHGLSPETAGASAVSGFWGLLTVGCLLGLLLLKVADSRQVLIGFSLFALISLTTALIGPAEWAVIAFPACGFFLSVMWSVIFSLALNSLPDHHGTFSGILCTAIIGGAVVPLLIGLLGDLIGLRYGMMILYLTLGYIFSIGFWARPLIANSTLFDGKKEG